MAWTKKRWIVIGATAGSSGAVGFDFLDRLLAAGSREATLALAGGLLWNIGNIFLLNAIMIAGLAVAFPIAQPIGNPSWLVAGSIVLVVAACINAQAYRELGGTSASKKRTLGIVLALVAGVLVGIFPPFVAAAISGEHALDTYSVTILFMLGASIATIVGIPLLLRKPFIGEAASLKRYAEAPPRAHLFGWLAGAIWCAGTFSNFISAGLVGVAISWGIGSGAPMVGALWGILLWREFRGASRRAWRLIATSLALYAAGVVLVAIAYQLR